MVQSQIRKQQLSIFLNQFGFWAKNYFDLRILLKIKGGILKHEAIACKVKVFQGNFTQSMVGFPYTLFTRSRSVVLKRTGTMRIVPVTPLLVASMTLPLDLTSVHK